jgi:subtilase family serine protease
MCAVCLCLAAGSYSTYAQSGVRDRVVGPVDNSQSSVLSGNLRPSLRPEFDRGPLDPATRLGRVTMFFNRTQQQESDLQTLLTQQQDPASANYHRWLTPEEFGARFGLSQPDVDKIAAWLQAQGLTIVEVSRSRTWVAFSGTAQQVGAALHADLHRYAVGGEMHFALSGEPSVPSAFAGVVIGFRGLDDFRLKPHAVKKVDPRFTSGVSGSHFLAPGDLATIYNLAPLYNLASPVDGTGQTIAVVGQTAINVSDVDTFRSLSGLSVNHPKVTLIPGSADPGMLVGDIDEANLDLDWVGAVARNATILYVYADPVNGNGVLDALTYVIDNKVAPVASMSYGLCEDPTGVIGFTQSNASALASQAQQANAFGITIIAPSGDSGAADCDSNVPAQQGLAVDLPGATPYVTSVGGTEFSGDANNPPISSGYWLGSIGNEVLNSARSYIPETSWNDTNAQNGLAATGGGSSIYFPKPSWQTGSGVPNDGARDVPDISFSASGGHDGYLACSEDNSNGTFQPTCVVGFRQTAGGNLTFFGGTSTGVPVFAGIVGLINQQANTPNGQGNVNPHLYAMANTGSRASFFNDTTTGNNAVPFQPANLPDCVQNGTVALGYVAGAGYDQVTGLGSINAQNLVGNWTTVATPAAGASVSPNFSIAVSAARLTVKRGSCGSTQVVLTAPNGFAGTPVFTCAASAPLTAVTCSVSPVASAVPPMPEKTPANRWWPLGMVVVAICFWAAALRARRQWLREAHSTSPPRRRLWAPGLALAGVLAMAIGCGGGGGSTGTVLTTSTTTSNYVFIVDAPTGSSTGTTGVTVTGMIGGVSRSTAMTLTVN